MADDFFFRLVTDLFLGLFGFMLVTVFCILEVCHPRCVCENWKGYVVKHNYVK